MFPGKTEYIEEPVEPERTGDEKIDALLADGERAVSEMQQLRESIGEARLKEKIGDIIVITNKIFKDVIEDPDDYSQIKRFSDFYLPTTIKLLHTYDRLGRSGTAGENITGTLARIDTALDTILDSYRKFFDSLFENQALDIETDIRVLESVLKKEGLTGKDF